jgi:hypothetical protein|tara:strand:+ start:1077 stop:1595 length:519 start_codon:yes stop_codon:yes gene_type:complete
MIITEQKKWRVMTKKTKTTSKKQVVVSQQEFINKETGELEKFNVVNQYDQDFNFEKLWLGHILDSLDIIGNKKIKVLNWLLANKNAQNQVIGTQRKIAKSAQVSLQVVSNTMSMLIQSNLIKKVQDGVYMLNPEIIFKGKNSQRMNVLLRYNNINQIEQNKEIEEKKEEDNG